MTGKIEDTHGMGKTRTFKQYCEYLGIDFEKKTFSRPHKPWRLPTGFKELNDNFCVRNI